MMTRDEIRRRALRAAAAVSLTVGALGCSAEIVTGAETSGSTAGGGPALGSGGGSAQGSGGAGGAMEGTGGVGGALADAGTDAPTQCDRTSPDYTACCDANHWSPSAGCEAWGPPMPPAMGVA